MRKKPFFLVVLFSSLFFPRFEAAATDCKANCEKHYSKLWQTAELSRCQTEREIACRYGITNCDTFKVPLLREGYNAVRLTIQKMNEETGWPKDPNECHQNAGYLTATHSISEADPSVKNWKYLKPLLDSATRVANSASNYGLWTVAAKEGAKAVINCGCKEASYRYKHSADSDTMPGEDYFIVSMVNDDTFSMYRGDNNLANRRALTKRAKDGVGRSSERVLTSTISKSMRTVTEVLCNEGSTWKTGTGTASIEGMLDKVNQLNWSGCLFRSSNFAGREPNVKDRYYVSVVNGNRWGMKTGAASDKDAVLQGAIQNAGGDYDRKFSGYFSTYRPTRTILTCEDVTKEDGGVEISGGFRSLFGGVGYESVRKAIKAAENSKSVKCRFEVSDADFGPVEKLTRSTAVSR